LVNEVVDLFVGGVNLTLDSGFVVWNFGNQEFFADVNLFEKETPF